MIPSHRMELVLKQSKRKVEVNKLKLSRFAEFHFNDVSVLILKRSSFSKVLEQSILRLLDYLCVEFNVRSKSFHSPLSSRKFSIELTSSNDLTRYSCDRTTICIIGCDHAATIQSPLLLYFVTGRFFIRYRHALLQEKRREIHGRLRL